MKLVILSGGVDSSTCLGLAKEKDDDVIALTFTYNQKHLKYELEASKKIAKNYDAKHIIMDVSNIFENGKSSLNSLNNLDVTTGEYKDQENPNTEVEFRNGIFLSIATGIALQYGADEVYYGAHLDDSGAIYADCKPEFIKTLTELIEIGSRGKVKLIAPFKDKTKSEVVSIGKKINVPYELTYSCYNGVYPPCGVCGTCIDRKKAFRENGLEIM